MIHNSSTTPTKSNLTGGPGLILICAPSHDNLTEYTSKLLENFSALGAPTVLRKIESPLTYDQLLTELSLDPVATEIMLIFCGHGEPTALLGPADHPGAPDYRDTVASFYDESHLHLGPKLMLAFCCSAAAGLGASYDHKTHGRAFVGFKDDILILKEDGNYADCWRAILHGLASALLNASTRTKLEKSVRKIYAEALASFSPDKDNVNNWGLMMRASLLQQLADIKVILT